MKKLLFSMALMLSYSLWGQSPGGVNSELRIWLKANDGFSPSSWSDRSGSGNTFTQFNVTRMPSLVAASPQNNFNPSVDFGPANVSAQAKFMVVPTNGPYIANNIGNTMFLMVSAKDLSGFRDYLGFGGTTTGAGLTNANVPVATNNTNSNTAVQLYPVAGGNFTLARTLNKLHMVDFSYPFAGTTTPISAGLDGRTQVASASFTSNTNRGAILGSQPEIAAADMGEIIAYQRELTAAEMVRVRSYLAVKYGITLSQPQNYMASNGTIVIWNSSRNSSFNNNIFGLAKDDGSALDQRVSNSINNGTILTVANNNDFTSANAAGSRTSFAQDRTFLLFGDNDNTSTSLLNVPAGLNPNGDKKRIQRVWQVEKVNDTGVTWLQADLSSYEINSNIFMMVADDPNFTTNLIKVPGVIVNGKVTFNYNFPANKYITFAGEIAQGTCQQCTGGKVFQFDTGRAWANGGQVARDNNEISNISLGTTSQGELKIIKMKSDYSVDPSVEYAPRAYPRWIGGTWMLTRRYDNTNVVVKHSVELNQAVKARFQISNINKYLNNANFFTVKGYCDGVVVQPKVTYGYPVNNNTTFRIDPDNTLHGTKPFRGFTYLYSTANIVFDRPVQRIEIECRVERTNTLKTLRSLAWGQMTFECAANPDPNPDNMYMYQSFTTNPIFACNETTMMMRIINNNAVAKTININNTLPAGLAYVPNSYNDVELPANSPQPTYGGTLFSLNNLVVPPGDHTIYINVKPTANVSTTYQTQGSFTVNGNTYNSDGDPATAGFQTSPLQVLEGANVDTSKFKLTKTANATCSKNGQQVTYRLTIENNSGADVNGAVLEEDLQYGQTVQGYTLNGGLTGTPVVDPIGGTILHLSNMKIPMGTSYVEMVVNINDSYTNSNNTSLFNFFKVELAPDSPCGNGGAITSNIIDIPVCDYCTKDPATGTPEGMTRIGITGYTNIQNGWPGNIPNGFMALESKNKGMVITRTTSGSIAKPIEGMLIYDIADKCFKLYNGTEWKCITRACND